MSHVGGGALRKSCSVACGRDHRSLREFGRVDEAERLVPLPQLPTAAVVRQREDV